jgi:TRAP-type C4-dicarboxylate transport system permease small subunit
MESEPLRWHGVVRAFDRVSLLLMDLGIVVTGLLFANIVVNVVGRKLFGEPIIWSVDVAQYLMVYLTFLPAAWLLLHGRHIRMTLVIDRLRARERRSAILAGDAIALVYSGVLTWQGWLAAHEALVSHIDFPTISAIPEFPILVAIPICAGWLCLAAVVKIVAFAGADPRLPGSAGADAFESGAVNTLGAVEE